MMPGDRPSFLGHRIAQRHVEIGPQNRQHDPRHAAAGADIEHRFARLQKSLQPLAIDDIAGDEFFVVGMPGQIEPRIPIPKPLAIVVQQRNLVVGEFDAVPGKRGGQIVGRVHARCAILSLPYMYRLRRRLSIDPSAASGTFGSRRVRASLQFRRVLPQCPPKSPQVTLNHSMWPNSDETQELLSEARGGDATAVNRLLERHRAALRRMIDLRMDRVIGRRVDASDIVQDVLLDAHRRLEEYLANPAMPFHLWLRQMARDRLIDAHRRHRVAARRSIDREQPMVAPAMLDHSTLDLAAELADPELTPAAAATWHELQVRFQQALDQMDEQDREVVLLRHFEHLSNGEVAEVLGLSEPAAGMRYLRAMRRLRSHFQEPTSDAAPPRKPQPPNDSPRRNSLASFAPA